MTTNQLLSLFISSKMAELAEERQAVQRALNAYPMYAMYGWLFEKDAGARPESIQQTYLAEVASCDIYIGLFCARQVCRSAAPERGITER